LPIGIGKSSLNLIAIRAESGLTSRCRHGTHQTPIRINYRDRRPSEQSCQAGGLLVTVPHLEEDGFIHEVTHTDAAFGAIEDLPGNDPDQYAVLDHGRNRMLHEPQGIADQEMPADIGWLPHVVVNPSLGLLDNDGSSRCRVTQSYPGTEESPLQPSSSWSPQNQQGVGG
jgi:hypothetical protein